MIQPCQDSSAKTAASVSHEQKSDNTWDWKKQAWRDWWRNEREAWSCCRLRLRRPYLERVWPMTMWGQDRLLKWVSWVEYCTLYYTATHLALPEWIFDWGLIQLKVQIIRTSTTISINRIRLNFYLFLYLLITSDQKPRTDCTGLSINKGCTREFLCNYKTAFLCLYRNSHDTLDVCCLDKFVS